MDLKTLKFEIDSLKLIKCYFRPSLQTIFRRKSKKIKMSILYLSLSNSYTKGSYDFKVHSLKFSLWKLCHIICLHICGLIEKKQIIYFEQFNKVVPE